VNIELPDEYTDVSQVIINMDSSMGTASDEWANNPDGIRIESYAGNTFNAHIMIVRDPSRIYMGTSSEKFSTSIPGKRITEAMESTPDAVAAINAGAFYDDGTSSPVVGSVPAGVVFAGGKMVWDAYHGLVPQKGFAGFNQDNILIVAKSMTAAEAEAQGIRDGCEFGPVLIMNGEINMDAYNTNSGYNPRTAIGQRADGTVILLCVDGRQAGSLGATYADLINIMVEYGAVNACNLDGGASTTMMYRDTYGRYGEEGEIVMINNYAILQEVPRKMPTFFMVSPATTDSEE
jgi:exopolysaccharide biosynthesis protein